MSNRQKWQKELYSKYWLNKVKKYGFDSYCKGLCKLIESKSPNSVYELAIGTGYPFAINFFKKGILVKGSDISEILIQELRNNCPDIQSQIISYEKIEPEDPVDVVYCFRSTWYFPDILKALDVMFSLAKKGGCVFFDIMNKDNDYIKKIVIYHRFMIPFTLSKNIFKYTVNKLLGKNYLLQDLWNIQEIPVSEKLIIKYLNDKNISYRKYSINQVIDNTDSNFITLGEFNSKIVFECIVPELSTN
jgi:SAM-dependent methyltransferase